MMPSVLPLGRGDEGGVGGGKARRPGGVRWLENPRQPAGLGAQAEKGKAPAQGSVHLPGANNKQTKHEDHRAGWGSTRRGHGILVM